VHKLSTGYPQAAQLAQVLHELTQGQCVYASGYLRTNTGLTQD